VSISHRIKATTLEIEHDKQEKPKLVSDLRPFIPAGSPEAVLQPELIDFHSREQLRVVFKKHNVDTVISALKLQGGDEWKVEVNLLWAAIDAGARRFSPSNYAGPIEKYGASCTVCFCFLLG
jgi:hypothetical protein